MTKVETRLKQISDDLNNLTQDIGTDLAQMKGASISAIRMALNEIIASADLIDYYYYKVNDNTMSE